MLQVNHKPLTQEIPPPPPPGISMEEANELRENIERLEGELVELRAELAAKDDANNQLSKDRWREFSCYLKSEYNTISVFQDFLLILTY